MIFLEIKSLSFTFGYNGFLVALNFEHGLGYANSNLKALEFTSATATNASGEFNADLVKQLNCDLKGFKILVWADKYFVSGIEETLSHVETMLENRVIETILAFCEPSIIRS